MKFCTPSTPKLFGLWIALLVLLPWAAVGDTTRVPTGITVGAAVGGANNTILHINESGLASSSTWLAADGSGAGNGVFKVAKSNYTSPTSMQTFHHLNATSPNAAQVFRFVEFDFDTTAGTAPTGLQGLFLRLGNAANYTGTGLGLAGHFQVRTASTANSFNANTAVVGDANGAGSAQSGVTGSAKGTFTTVGVGVQGYTQSSAAVPQAGVVGQVMTGTAASNAAGVLATVEENSSDAQATTLASLIVGKAALVATNRNSTFDIAVFNDYLTPILAVADGGSLQGKRTKTLVSASATAFSQVAVPSGDHALVEYTYQLYCADATNRVVRSGRALLNCHNTAGTEGCTVLDQQTTDSGSGGATFTAATFGFDTTPVNAVNVTMNANCSLAETTLEIDYFPPIVTKRQTVTPQ